MATASRTVTMRWLRFFGSRPDGWWRDRGRAMAALVKRLEQRAAAEGADVTVVFERPLSPPIESSVINVANAPKAAANSADDEIVRLVRADSDPAQIRVATSDCMLTERVQAAGAGTDDAWDQPSGSRPNHTNIGRNCQRHERVGARRPERIAMAM